MPVPAWSPAAARAAEWFRRSEGVRWGVSADAFARVLGASVAHAFKGAPPDAGAIDRYVDALHHRDLALSCACAAGHDRAWEVFVAEYRPVLSRAADAIDPTGGARELADAIHADLYGLRDRDGERQSLLRYFHGRSSLATWLRAVLAQRVVDRARATRRTDPLPEPDDVPLADPHASGPDPERAPCVGAVSRALAAAIAALDARDRLRLGAYYVQHLTLAEIGRLLKEHEASVSRHLTRIRAGIRVSMESHLRDRERLSDAAAAECVRSVLDDAGALDLGPLVGRPAPAGTGKNDARRRSKD